MAFKKIAIPDIDSFSPEKFLKADIVALVKIAESLILEHDPNLDQIALHPRLFPSEKLARCPVSEEDFEFAFFRIGEKIRNLYLKLSEIPSTSSVELVKTKLGALMDCHEIPKEMHWIETHFPPQAFFDGFQRFQRSEYNEFKFAINFLGNLSPHFGTIPCGYSEDLATLNQNITYLNSPDFWDRFPDKYLFATGRKVIEKMIDWINIHVRKAEDLVTLDLVAILTVMEVQLYQMHLDRIDQPPDTEFMNKIPIERSSPNKLRKFFDDCSPGLAAQIQES